MYYFYIIIYTRIKKSFTYLGKMYLVKPYMIITKSVKANVIWFIKKNGTNCGIFLFLSFYTCTDYIKYNGILILILHILSLFEIIIIIIIFIN